MLHNEKEITKKAKKILKDIKFLYYEDKPFNIKYTESKGLLGKDSKIEKGILVSVYWFDPDYLGGNNVTAFLTINDETGEPEIFSVRSGGGGNWVIKKNNVGNYFVESNY